MQVKQDKEKVTQILLGIKNAERRYRDKAALAFLTEPELLPVLIDFISHKKEYLADRACWTLELVCVREPDLLCPLTDKIIGQLEHCRSDRQRRPLSKIFSLLTEPVNSLQEPFCDLSESVVEELIAWGFDQIITQRPVAVKVFSMQILCNLKDRKPWIRNELRSILQENMHGESPGYRSRAKKILGQI